MTTYDALSESYDAGRLGYAGDLYNTLVEYGLAPSHKILDVGCGTGLASAPLVQNDYDVTGVDISEPMLARARSHYPQSRFICASAESLPFDAESFDLVMSAQALHHIDRSAAMREMLRVLKPNGIVAIWWKYLMSDDRAKRLGEETMRELGVEPPLSGLKGGFKEFYAAPLREHSLRVIPWRSAMPLSKYLQYERSRKSVLDAFAGNAEEYHSRLEDRMRAAFGDGDPLVPLAYTHYLYLGKK